MSHVRIDRKFPIIVCICITIICSVITKFRNSLRLKLRLFVRHRKVIETQLNCVYIQIKFKYFVDISVYLLYFSVAFDVIHRFAVAFPCKKFHFKMIVQKRINGEIDESMLKKENTIIIKWLTRRHKTKFKTGIKPAKMWHLIASERDKWKNPKSPTIIINF